MTMETNTPSNTKEPEKFNFTFSVISKKNSYVNIYLENKTTGNNLYKIVEKLFPENNISIPGIENNENDITIAHHNIKIYLWEKKDTS